MGDKHNFVFRKHDSVGGLDAKEDKENLLDNFINTGDYGSVHDFSSPRVLLLGRTGVGKSALITKLMEDEKHVISIEPESLSLVYVQNSDLIKQLGDLGINFSLFFRLLWKHVLAVEVLKYHFEITDAEKKMNVVDQLKEKFGKLSKRNNHAKGLDYLDSYGGSFWKDTDYRIKEIVKNFEEEIIANLGAEAKPLIAQLKAGKKLAETQRIEVIHRAQDVVNKFQVKELVEIIKMIDDAIDDPQKKYYIVIDRLDENWVEDELRYQLIFGLIETVKDFNAVSSVKLMIALRSDLINRVYDLVKNPTFQEEKYTSLNLHLSWTKRQLISMLDQRIDSLIRKHYSGGSLTHKDVIVAEVDGQPSIDYMIDRTLMRPRDLINFYNNCIEEANESPFITAEMLKKAERNYSRERRTAVRQEWSGDYPGLTYWDKLLNSRPAKFKISDIDNWEIERLCLLYDESSVNRERFQRDLLHDQLDKLLAEKISINEFKKYLLQALYQVGYVGVALPDFDQPIWSYEPRKLLQVEEIDDGTTFHIHKSFWTCFNVVHA